MMASDAKIYAEFGKGSVSTGAFKVDALNLWCISIKELKEDMPIGTIIPKDYEFVGLNEIVLAFPDKNQMLSTLAALTNQDIDFICEKWRKAITEKEAV